MQPTNSNGVYRRGDKIFTINPPSCHGTTVYNEHLVTEDDTEYRSWNPYRSKLAAAFLKKLTINIPGNASVLYLGAATGTTVSHISDITAQGAVYAVENAPLAMAKLLGVSEQRPNIIPIFADANHPDRYTSIVPSQVDLVYQDVAQRNQADIFLTNLERYLKPQGTGILMVKARSINVAIPPKEAYFQVNQALQRGGCTIEKTMDLAPYDKDHAVFVVHHD
jgi:fibrillarin-like pre-rRNA processing protein